MVEPNKYVVASEMTLMMSFLGSYSAWCFSSDNWIGRLVETRFELFSAVVQFVGLAGVFRVPPSAATDESGAKNNSNIAKYPTSVRSLPIDSIKSKPNKDQVGEGTRTSFASLCGRSNVQLYEQGDLVGFQKKNACLPCTVFRSILVSFSPR
jgi:hypothetical protein